MVRYAAPLREGDRIGVTATSSGVPPPMRERLEVALAAVRRRGYAVELGECLYGTGHVSAPAQARAAEFMAMMQDPSIKAVVPPWGGETGIDMLSLLDWDALRTVEPTWVVGYSDVATLITPLTMVAGMATVHGGNLMDTPYRVPSGMVSWLDIAEMPTGSTFAQTPTGRYRRDAHVDYAQDAAASELDLDAVGGWWRLDDTGDVHVRGRLVGGCIETISPLTGGPLADMSGFRAEHAGEETLVYIEAAESGSFAICRALHGMRLAGFFDGAQAVLVGRTNAPDDQGMTQHEAVLDALGSLGVPIVAGVDCGHVAPFMPLVNGAHAEVWLRGDSARITQTLR
ncbi:MAG: S66 peptidase family protein [Ornithinimicrobium sp.]